MNVVNGQIFDGAFNGRPSDFNGKRKRNRNRKHRNVDRGEGTAKPKFDKTELCDKCGCYTHPTNKCMTPKHLATNNPRDTKHLKGKGLKPISTFIQMAPMELVVRMMFLLDLATP